MGTREQGWTPEGHLHLLLTEADKIPCDSGDVADLNLELPPWFDEDRFKCGQKFFTDNLFSTFVGMLAGLLAVLAIPSILRVLMFTERSSTTRTAYRRYIATILHTVSWFDVELTNNPSSWKSLAMVRKRHLSSSLSACRHGMGLISQKDMVLTQFGFMGFMIIRPKYLGLLHTTREARDGFVYFWRCIGFVLGIEDRFNLCSGTLEETEALCEVLIASPFRAELSATSPDYERMSNALLSGVWTFDPFLDACAMTYFLKRMVGVKNYHYFRSDLPKYSCENNNILNNDKAKENTKIEMSEEYKGLHWYSKFLLWLMIVLLQVLFRYAAVRWFFNSLRQSSIFLIKHFPFLGFHRFGFKSSFVDIRIDSYKEKGE